MDLPKRIRKPDTRDGWYELTPAWCASVLENKSRKNRPLKHRFIKRLSAQITKGRWAMNGESVVFDHAGVLMDGQNRLRACIDAGRNIECYLVFLPETVSSMRAFDTMDTGNMRSAADRLALDGAPYYATVASIVKGAMLYERGIYSTGGATYSPSHDEIRVCYHKDEAAFNEAAAIYSPLLSSDMRGRIPGSIVGLVYYLTKKADAKKADAFIDAFLSGEGLESGSAVLVARKRILKHDLPGSRRLRNRELLGIMIKAYNAFASGSSVRMLKLDENEALPAVLDAA